jgi:hypothetical protein
MEKTEEDVETFARNEVLKLVEGVIAKITEERLFYPEKAPTEKKNQYRTPISDLLDSLSLGFLRPEEQMMYQIDHSKNLNIHVLGKHKELNIIQLNVLKQRYG